MEEHEGGKRHPSGAPPILIGALFAVMPVCSIHGFRYMHCCSFHLTACSANSLVGDEERGGLSDVEAKRYCLKDCRSCWPIKYSGNVAIGVHELHPFLCCATAQASTTARCSRVMQWSCWRLEMDRAHTQHAIPKSVYFLEGADFNMEGIRSSNSVEQYCHADPTPAPEPKAVHAERAPGLLNSSKPAIPPARVP